MYVTPERFRTMGLGIDLTGVEDIDLRSTLTRASSVVDALCSIATLPQQHDFRGGTITGEQHEWPVSAYDTGVRPFRIYPWHRPVTAVSSIKIFSTPTVYTEITSDEIFINNSGGYIEVASLKLTQFGIFGTIQTLIGMWNPVSVTDYTYGYSFVATNEYLEATDAFLYRAQNQWWATSPVPEIKKNGVVQSSGFTIDYDEGTVLFATALAATDTVTASYTYKLPWQIREATGLIAAEDYGEARMRERGMSGIDTLQVGEITIRRSAPGGSTRSSATAVEQRTLSKIDTLLAGFNQVTVR